MTAIPQAIDQREKIAAILRPFVADEYLLADTILAVSPTLSLAAPGQSATDAAQAVAQADLDRRGIDTSWNDRLVADIAQAIAAFAAAQVAAALDECAEGLERKTRQGFFSRRGCCKRALETSAAAIRARQAS